MVKKFALTGSILLIISWLIEGMLSFNLINPSYFIVSLQFLFSRIPGYYWQFLQNLGYSLYFCEVIYTRRIFLIFSSLLIIMGKIMSSFYFSDVLNVNIRVTSFGLDVALMGFILYLVGFSRYRKSVKIAYYSLVTFIILLVCEIFILYGLFLSQSEEFNQFFASFWNLGLLTIFIFHGMALAFSRNSLTKILETNEEKSLIEKK